MPMTLPPRCTQAYEVGEPIAAGGCGAVYRATHRALNRPVALMVLHAKALEVQHSVERFLAEARVTASLAHPHVIIVLDHDVEDGVPWIAYEFVEGPTLRALIQSSPIPWARALKMAAQVASALEAAHRAGVLHRDVKPENMFEVQPGHVKVADFGIARWSESSFQTEAGVLVGTPAYLAPEVCRGQPPGPQSDVYALGITLFELLTATRPFTGPNVMTVLRAQLTEEAPRVRGRRPEVPENVDALVHRMLAKDPEDRPRGAAQVIAQIEEILGPVLDASATSFANVPAAPVLDSPPRRPSRALRDPARDRAPAVRRLRSKQTAIAAVAGLAVLAGIGLAAFSLRGPSPPPPLPPSASPAADVHAAAAALLERLESDRDAAAHEYNSILELIMSGDGAKQVQAGQFARKNAELARRHLTELEAALHALGAQEPEESTRKLVVRAALSGWIAYYRLRIDRLVNRVRVADIAVRERLDSTFHMDKLMELDGKTMQYHPDVLPVVLSTLNVLQAAAARAARSPGDVPLLFGQLVMTVIVVADQFTFYRFRGDAQARLEEFVERWLPRLEAADPPSGLRVGRFIADVWRVAAVGDAARKPAEAARALEGFAAARRAMPQATPSLEIAEARFRRRIRKDAGPREAQ